MILFHSVIAGDHEQVKHPDIIKFSQTGHHKPRLYFPKAPLESFRNSNRSQWFTIGPEQRITKSKFKDTRRLHLEIPTKELLLLLTTTRRGYIELTAYRIKRDPIVLQNK